MTIRDAHRHACSQARQANHAYHRQANKADTPENRRKLRVLELEWRHLQAICAKLFEAASQ